MITPNLGQALCIALGLDPNDVAQLTIDITAPGNVGTVTVVRSVRAPGELADTVARYRLVEAE